MSDPVYQGSYNDLLLNYGHDKAKAIMQWYNFADGWKLNDNLGLIASPDMDVISNPYIGVKIGKYNEIYKDRRSLDPYQNKDTGWIWNSDKGAYYWPSLPTTDMFGNTSTSYARYLRPGEGKKSHGMFGSFSPAVSFFTGGLSDVIQGDKLGEGFLGEKGGSLFQDFLLSTGTAGLSDAYKGYEKYQDIGDIFAGIDRAIDPGGVVDTWTRKIGSFLPDEIRQYAPALGSAIGSAIYPVAGTAAGYGIGAKLKGGEDVYNYKGDMIGAGTAAALAYLANGGMSKIGSYFSTPTAGEAASIGTDRELQYILNDMQSALSSDYDPSLVAGLRDYELNHILTDMGDAVSPNYTGSTETPVRFSSGRPVGTAHTLKGRSFDPYSGEDRGYWYDVDRMAPEEPTLDYPYPDPNNPTEPMYNESGMYDYTLPSEFDPNDLVTSSSGSWKDYLEDFLKVLKGLKIGGGTEGTPGYIKSWFGGSGLDMSEESYKNRSKGRRDLGMEMLEGTDLDLDKILNPYLEDYVYAGR